MTVFMLLILILRRFTEMGLLSINCEMIMLLSAFIYLTLRVVRNMTVFMSLILVAKVYRNGPPFHL